MPTLVEYASALFGFNVGDRVQHVLDRSDRPDCLLIVERWYHECPGGGQIIYLCRGGLWNKEAFPYNQIEVTAWTGGAPLTYNEKAGEDQRRHGERFGRRPAETPIRKEGDAA